jgi:DNA-binding PadR family transcriptional regulator
MIEHSRKRLSPEFVLLGFLAGSPSYGYELHQRLTEQFGDIWHASQSQTYNILKRLESQGFIRSTSVEQEKLPSRQQLQLTASGVDRFDAWLAQPTNPSVHAIRVEFITRLYFLQRYHPERLDEMIDDQVSVVRAGLAQLASQLEKLPKERVINRLALELRLELLGSVARWLDQVSMAIKEGEA